MKEAVAVVWLAFFILILAVSLVILPHYAFTHNSVLSIVASVVVYVFGMLVLSETGNIPLTKYWLGGLALFHPGFLLGRAAVYRHNVLFLVTSVAICFFALYLCSRKQKPIT